MRIKKQDTKNYPFYYLCLLFTISMIMLLSLWIPNAPHSLTSEINNNYHNYQYHQKQEKLKEQQKQKKEEQKRDEMNQQADKIQKEIEKHYLDYDLKKSINQEWINRQQKAINEIDAKYTEKLMSNRKDELQNQLDDIKKRYKTAKEAG